MDGKDDNDIEFSSLLPQPCSRKTVKSFKFLYMVASYVRTYMYLALHEERSL